MRSLDVPSLETAMHNLDYPAFVAMTKSEDTVEGPKAFAEKRKPNWGRQIRGRGVQGIGLAGSCRERPQPRVPRGTWAIWRGENPLTWE